MSTLPGPLKLNMLGRIRHIAVIGAESIASGMGCSRECLERIETTPIEDLPVLVVVAFFEALGVAPGPKSQSALALGPLQAQRLAMHGLLIETAPGVFVSSPMVRNAFELAREALSGRRIDVAFELDAHEAAPPSERLAAETET